MKKDPELFSNELPPDEFSRPTLRMIYTLKECVEMENKYPDKSYGPGDFKGSFLGLYKRGLLGIRAKNNTPRTSWYVTSQGLNFLVNIAEDDLNRE